jgi:CubicO group peptidase (beta-lactamase class C family)
MGIKLDTLFPAPSRSCRRTGPVLYALLALISMSASTATAQSDQTLQRLDAIAGAGVNENRAVGLVAAVVRGEDTLLMNAYGNANVEWDIPMTTDAMFEVGSIAKQFTAAAILKLRDAGRLSLDDPITKWLPDLGESGDTVTLRRMLSHTSGINHFSEARDWEMNYFTPGIPRDSLYHLIEIEPFQFPPGQVQAYNSSAFWLLGLVVEKASGMRYEDYVRTMFFEPLGMTRSMYCDSSANVPRRAHGYAMQNGMIRRALSRFSSTWTKRLRQEGRLLSA